MRSFNQTQFAMQPTDLLNQEGNSVEVLSRSAFVTGRKVGILLLLQLAAALTLPFILAHAITVGSPAFLTAVAKESFQVRTAVLLSFVGSALTVYLGITAFPVFRRYSKSAALLFLVVCAVSCTLDVVQAGTIMSMLAISNRFVEAGAAADSELYQVVAAAVASARRSAHATQLLAIGAWMFVFYVSLLRFQLVPRVLAVAGVIGVALQFTGVTLMMFLGYPSIGQMAMPLLPIQIAVAVWLIAKGFRVHPAAPNRREFSAA
ncbi:DUF4386 domain-containing protein [Hymenobacter sp. BT770]|uniref:DUF4386 domain-containing protein n=1 Tax=Hymenobacter sp. BT770 TaxID=2886942 RepID=UPI001D1015FC|nr:DUF4386 domain-containing protein [Hymenobacter sp. BT770]MCC3151592.1 DUF4386 domain-containing protein [Hymenobacter sp. BT770]MDO3413831.1 DUF4386 domain-containing protein [Hymenobacter sp. BT770]